MFAEWVCSVFVSGGPGSFTVGLQDEQTDPKYRIVYSQSFIVLPFERPQRKGPKGEPILCRFPMGSEPSIRACECHPSHALILAPGRDTESRISKCVGKALILPKICSPRRENRTKVEPLDRGQRFGEALQFDLSC